MTMSYQPAIRRRAPAPVRYGLFILVGVMVLFAAIASRTGIGKVVVEPEPAIESMAIRFADQPDGSIAVFDPASDARIHVYEAETAGFVRTALRALAFDRRKLGVGPEPAFELMRSESGRLTLYDPTTEKFVTLEAFGKANAESFSQLFAKKSGGIE